MADQVFLTQFINASIQPVRETIQQKTIRRNSEEMDTVKKPKNFLSYWYQRYLLATELYMVEPWERVVIHIIFAILFWLFWSFNYNFVVSSIAQLRSGPTQFTKEIS
ncbi:small subunit of serine palmitoyltransferase-like domain-containing protein [Phthorimaea operculella]|nr:small subunit of serine palmitoyltransferase-like domain-containing protein [Phthorimaea operculella]